MILQDDQALVNSSTDRIVANLQKLKALSIDRVRVSVVWGLIAPDLGSSRRPTFDAPDPAAHPAESWSRNDVIDFAAHKIGIGVYFQPTAPLPRCRGSITGGVYNEPNIGGWITPSGPRSAAVPSRPPR